MATFAQLRKCALALPGAVEIVYRGEPWFNVGKKSFALRSNGKIIMKLDREHQEMLFEVRPEVFTPCPVATVKWSYVDIAALTAHELKALVTEAWTQIVPKKISAANSTARRTRRQEKLPRHRKRSRSGD
jgi:hypothetical protein